MRWFLRGDEINVTTSCLMITIGSILVLMVPLTTISAKARQSIP